jgi:uncharacterized protein YeaO (DUF488 family)
MDITLGTRDPLGRLFAPPSWDFVMGYKAGKINDAEYKKIYLSTITRRYNKMSELFKKVLLKKEVTFVCYCRKGSFCHRVIIAEWFQQQFLDCTYKGER